MQGLVARFTTSDALLAAVRQLREGGYRRFDAFTPFPVPGLGELLDEPGGRIGGIAITFALIGGGLTYLMIYWSSVIDYPLNIGGRPLHSWPAFVPVVLVAAALWSGLATLIGMLWLCGLPRWHHPLFGVRQFDRATYDRFFLMVAADDPHFSEDELGRLLERAGAEHVGRLEEGGDGA